jgi:hypothetical protein
VTELASESIHSAHNLAAGDNATSDTRAQSDSYKIVDTTPRTEARLTECGRIGVVLQNNLFTRRFSHQSGERNDSTPSQVRRVQNLTRKIVPIRSAQSKVRGSRPIEMGKQRLGLPSDFLGEQLGPSFNDEVACCKAGPLQYFSSPRHEGDRGTCTAEINGEENIFVFHPLR